MNIVPHIQKGKNRFIKRNIVNKGEENIYVTQDTNKMKIMINMIWNLNEKKNNTKIPTSKNVESEGEKKEREAKKNWFSISQ